MGRATCQQANNGCGWCCASWGNPAPCLHYQLQYHEEDWPLPIMMPFSHRVPPWLPAQPMDGAGPAKWVRGRVVAKKRPARFLCATAGLAHNAPAPCQSSHRYRPRQQSGSLQKMRDDAGDHHPSKDQPCWLCNVRHSRCKSRNPTSKKAQFRAARRMALCVGLQQCSLAVLCRPSRIQNLVPFFS